MRFQLVRFINMYLLAVVSVLTLTGLYGLFWAMPGWTFDLHRYAGWALVAGLPLKTLVSIRSLQRGLRLNFDRGVLIAISLLAAVIILLVIYLAFAWRWRFEADSYWLRQTAISWHWMLALGLLAPLIVHILRRWPHPKPVDFASRRGFLTLAGLGLLGLAGWQIGSRLARIRRAASAVAGTGSRLASAYSGNRFPVTHNRSASPEQVTPAVWRLTVDGLVTRPVELTRESLAALPAQSVEATLDCTLGWYTVQRWVGTPLFDLLQRAGVGPAARYIRIHSVTGAAHAYPIEVAGSILLATHVEDEAGVPEPLDHSHGAPLRAVVPGMRGWFWVKWINRIEVL